MANIGVLYTNGKLRYITLRRNGTPEICGKILKTYYNNQRAVRRLIGLGDLFTISGDDSINGSDEAITHRHVLSGIKARTCKSVSEYMIEYRNSGISFSYLYIVEKQRWLFYDNMFNYISPGGI